MAEDRTFTLIGNFTDNITPKLRSINEQITSLNGTIAKFKENGRSLSKEFGSVATSLTAVTSAVKANRTAITNNNADLQKYLKTLKEIQTEQQKVSKFAPPRIPSSGGGGGGLGQSYRGGGAPGIAAGVFGVTLGSKLDLTTPIVSGFRIGVGLMEKPFQAAANAFGERIKDEASDIQSAGGLFAISQRKGLGLFPDFNSAMREQQRINSRLAASAAALPGETEEYVRQGKLLTDTMIQVFAKNKEGTIAFSKSLGADGTSKDAIGTIIQKFTEKAVLLGQGGSSRSIYGIPQLTERLINADKVSPTMFSKYAAFINNPMLQNAFKEMTPQLAKTAAGSAERLKLAYQLLDQSLPNEVIQAYKASVGGTLENFRSLLFSPEVGIFGLGRKFKNIAPEVDQLGRYINAQGKVVNDINLAAKDSLSIFDLLKDIIVGFGNPIAEVIPVFLQLFDPLKALTGDLVGLRTVAQDFYRNFNGFTAYFEHLGKALGSVNISGTAKARGALAAINNLLRALGAISPDQFKATGDALKGRNANLPEIASNLVKQLFDSDFMRQIGEVIGRVIGNTLTMVANIMTGASDITTVGGFAGGLKAGFDAAKGTEAVTTVFNTLLDLFVKGIIAIFQAAPLQTSILAGLVVLGPAIAAALGTMIVQAIPRMLAGGGLLAAGGGGAAAVGGAAAAGGAAAGGSSLLRLFGSSAGISAASKAREFVGEIGQVSKAFLPVVKTPSAISNIVKFGGAAKAFIPGRIPLIGAGLDVGSRMLQGQGLAKSLGGGAANLAGTIVGGAIGTFFGPGVGTAIGATAGGILGDIIYDKLTQGPNTAITAAAAQQQLRAAELQKQAAELQGQAAKLSRGGSGGNTFGQAKDFTARLNYLGITGAKANAASNAYLARNVAAEKADAAYKRMVERQDALLKAGFSIDKVKALSKPLTDAYGVASKNLVSKSSELEKAMGALGPKANIALAESLQKMPTGMIQQALANKIASLNFDIKPMLLSANILGGGSNPANLEKSLLNDTSIKKPTFQWKTGNIIQDSDLSNVFGQAFGSNHSYSSSLGGAIAYEMAHKPSGSNIVIANSSEAVIPAAGGFGMSDLIGTMTSGFYNLTQNIAGIQQSLSKTIDGNQQKSDQKFATLAEKLTTLSGEVTKLSTMQGGSMLGIGGAGGNIVSVGQQLLAMGLQVGENPYFQYGAGYLPGGGGRVGQHAKGSYHYLGRALDVSGSVGQLNQVYAMLRGTNPSELLWQVPGHYDHLHVAYALGKGSPAFFGSQAQAMAWERQMMPSTAKVQSFTSNTSEGFGGGPSHVTVNSPITINQLPGQSPQELAALVAMEISNAVADVRNASYYV